jgi:hypothetical protein
MHVLSSPARIKGARLQSAQRKLVPLRFPCYSSGMDAPRGISHEEAERRAANTGLEVTDGARRILRAMTERGR